MTYVGHVPLVEAEVPLVVDQDLLDLRHDVLRKPEK